MRCFFHPDREAVGLCKNCQKGLCAESAIDVGDGLACPGRCEKRVERLNASLGKADELAGSWSGFMGPGVLVIGVGFLGFAALIGFAWDDPLSASFFALLGLVFAATPAKALLRRPRGRAI